MEYTELGISQMDPLWELQKLYKSEIGEAVPGEEEKERLSKAIGDGKILFFGAWDGDRLAGCCSVTVGFSTFDYLPGGVFEDFYILPAYRHGGIAKRLVEYAKRASGVSTLTVGCAACDESMYKALGFTVPLGSLLAFD